MNALTPNAPCAKRCSIFGHTHSRSRSYFAIAGRLDDTSCSPILECGFPLPTWTLVSAIHARDFFLCATILSSTERCSVCTQPPTHPNLVASSFTYSPQSVVRIGCRTLTALARFRSHIIAPECVHFWILVPHASSAKKSRTSDLRGSKSIWSSFQVMPTLF